VKDTAILEVGDLGIGIESASHSEGLSSVSGDHDVLSHDEVTAIHVNAEGLGAIKSVEVSTLTGLELHRKDTHSDEVRPVDALVALGNNCLDTLQVRALSSPIT